MSENDLAKTAAVYAQECGRLRGQVMELEAEVARLKAGGCARDQGLTQHCAEAAQFAAEVSRLREDLITVDAQYSALLKHSGRACVRAEAAEDRAEKAERERDEAVAREREAEIRGIKRAARVCCDRYSAPCAAVEELIHAREQPPTRDPRDDCPGKHGPQCCGYPADCRREMERGR